MVHHYNKTNFNLKDSLIQHINGAYTDARHNFSYLVYIVRYLLFVWTVDYFLLFQFSSFLLLYLLTIRVSGL